MTKTKNTEAVPADKAVIAQAIAEGRKMIEAGKSKIDTALAIYEKLEGMEQDVIVKAFIEGATLTEKGALTYLNRPGFAGGSNFQIGWSHDEQNDEQVFP